MFKLNIVPSKRSIYKEYPYIIYETRVDGTGYPHFLIYDERQWRWVSAKYFEPYSELAETAPINIEKITEGKTTYTSFLR